MHIEIDPFSIRRVFISTHISGGQMILIAIATLDDYFADIARWLPEYFSSKFMNEIFSLFVGTYLMSIRRLANGAFYFMVNNLYICNLGQSITNLLVSIDR